MNVVSHRNFASLPAPAAPTLGMISLVRMLGVEHESETSNRHTSPATRIAYVQMLIESAGFPPPLPHLGKGEDGAAALVPAINYRKSRWQRAAVDAWFDGIVPPQHRAAIDDQAARAAADRLDQAAEALAS